MIGDHLLCQHLGLLGRFESAIWSAPVNLGTDVPGQLPIERSRLADIKIVEHAVVIADLTGPWAADIASFMLLGDGVGAVGGAAWHAYVGLMACDLGNSDIQ